MCLFAHSLASPDSPFSPLWYHPQHPYPILSNTCNLPGVNEKLVASVVWRLGGGLLADLQLSSCAGVVPLGLELCSAQPLPWLCPGPMGDLACRGSCLCWLVRGKLTAPNAPNAARQCDRRPQFLRIRIIKNC